jgi:predicted GNAT family N-acyltransferase
VVTSIYKLAVDKADLEAAFEVRRQVFVEEQGISREMEFDGLDDETIHVVVMDAGRVIGAARVRFLDDSQAKIERMAILKPFRRKGIGTGMVSFLLGDLRKRQVKHVVLHAQHDVVPFYRSCGFEEVGEPFWEAGIKHLKMQMWL